MGVVDLWAILKEAETSVLLDDLSGKTLAVDLSCWIFESHQHSLYSHRRNSHLWLLIHRMRHLLRHDIKLVFVMEGEAPILKEEVLSQRKIDQKKYCKTTKFKNKVSTTEKERGEPHSSPTSSSRRNYDYTQGECQKLIQSLGVQCLKSSGEAEAMCALLNANGLVDGCISEDNDVFLYGGQAVYKEFSSKSEYLKQYLLKDINTKTGLDRKQMIALALLLGCDYGRKGVSGIGRERAMEFLKQLKNVDVLERFRSWRNDRSLDNLQFHLLSRRMLMHCNTCGHPGNEVKHKKSGCTHCMTENGCQTQTDETCPCEWHKVRKVKETLGVELDIRRKAQEIQDFPPEDVIKEYLEYTDSIPKEPIVWEKPDWLAFKDIVKDNLGWEEVKAWNFFLPILSAWQLINKAKSHETDSSHTHELTPLRILKRCIRQGKPCYIVEWGLPEEMMSNSSESYENETVEPEAVFNDAYPMIVQKFSLDNPKKSECKRKANPSLLKGQQSLDNLLSTPKKKYTTLKERGSGDTQTDDDDLEIVCDGKNVPATPTKSQIATPTKRQPRTPRKDRTRKTSSSHSNPSKITNFFQRIESAS